ncbi:MAG: lipoate--protein ligase family protein [Thermoplasmata archaeon]
MKFRIIVDSFREPAMNMSLDEAVLFSRQSVDYNTIRFYGWNPSAVSIGYFQNLDYEVDVNYAKKNGIALIRRITGGGAVYHWMNGEITYSIVASMDVINNVNVRNSYGILFSGIVEGLKSLGADARWSGINDISVGDRKISGNAQTRRYGSVLQHGTILVDVNPYEMFSVLKVSDEKIKDKMIKNIYERVTSLKNLGLNLQREKIIDAFIEGYRKSFNAYFYFGNFTDLEIELARKIYKKYSSMEWTKERINNVNL